MRPPFFPVAWACFDQTLAPPYTPCGLAVDFVRSCFQGFWRFYANAPAIVTPGRLFFVPRDTDHLGIPHPFGSSFWQEGDDNTNPQPPTLGHDRSLPWSWIPGIAPANLPLPIPIGTRADFEDGTTWPRGTDVTLRAGIDTRCYLPNMLGLIDTFLDLPIDACAWLRVQAAILKKIGDLDFASVGAALRIIFGPTTVITTDNGAGPFPPFCIMRNNACQIIFLYGTNSARLLANQIWQGIEGPTDFGAGYSALPVHQDHANRVTRLYNASGGSNGKPLLLSGHSMGGAVACILGMVYKNAVPAWQVYVTSFGCPKPGDARLSDFIRRNLPACHVHHAPDIVPQVPPSNAQRIGLQQAFPWIPDAWFTQWAPLHRYLRIYPGGVWRWEEYLDADLARYIAFVTLVMLRGADDPVTAHFLPSYIRSLGVRCPDVEAPFNAAVYVELEIPVGGAQAGATWGGGNNRELGVAQGVIWGGQGFHGGGLVGNAGVVWGGAGTLAPRPPGNTCATALAATLGVTYTFNLGAGNDHWFTWPLTDFVQYHARLTLNSGTAPTWSVYTNTCAGLNLQGGGLGSGCVQFTVGFQPNGYAQIQGPLLGTSNYSLVIDVGPC